MLYSAGSLFCFGNRFLDSLQVCLAAVGLVGDLCRALQSNILPFCDEVMQLLLENLGVSISQANWPVFEEVISWKDLHLKVCDKGAVGS